MRTVQTQSDAAYFRQAIESNECYAPRLIVSELGNALWKTVRFGGLNSDEAIRLLSIITAIPFLMEDERFIEAALEIAIEAEHPVYDCMFVAMGRAMDASILTADKKLRRKFPEDKFMSIDV